MTEIHSAAVYGPASARLSEEKRPETWNNRQLCAMRLCVAEAQEQMQLSLSKLGNLTPLQAWRTSASGSLEIFDGAKRWRAAQALSWPKLRVGAKDIQVALAARGPPIQPVLGAGRRNRKPQQAG